MLVLVVRAVKDCCRSALLKFMLAGRDSGGIGWTLVVVVVIVWIWW